MEHLFLFLDPWSLGKNKGSSSHSKNSFLLTSLSRPHWRSKPIPPTSPANYWCHFGRRQKPGKSKSFSTFFSSDQRHGLSGNGMSGINFTKMILPLWTILWFRKVSMHPFTNIQLGRTPLGLFSTFRKFQYWLCSSCKLWERHIWALFWWDRNNWSSPLIISIIRSFFFLSSHIFAKHFHYLLSLSLSETTTVCLSFFIMSTQAMPRILNWKTPLPSFKKISGERAGMSFRAGNKFKISWQSFIACLLLSRSPLLLKLLTLTEGRAYPSSGNAHRKTLIENDHFCAFWISCQRYRE